MGTIQKKRISEVVILLLMIMLMVVGGTSDRQNTGTVEETSVETEPILAECTDPLESGVQWLFAWGSISAEPIPEPTPTPEPISYLEQCELDYVELPAPRNREEALEYLAELSEEFPEFAYVVENESLYSDGMLGTIANNPEMADYAYRYPTAEQVVTGGLTEEELAQESPLFLQWDIRWGFHPYGMSVMGESGCGPTCLSMAVFYLTRNAEVTPDAVADYSMENRYYTKDIGTSWALMNDYPAEHGLHSYSIYRNQKEMKARLDDGDILILSVGPGHFTSGGHFIVIYDYDEEGFKVNDPRCIYRSRQSYPYKDIRKEIKNIWTVGVGLVETVPEETQEIVPTPMPEAVQESVPVEEMDEEDDEDEDDEDDDDDDE